MNTSGSNDRDLVERARAGDRPAIGELFERYWRAARGAAYGAVGDWAVAEDAGSEAFRRALEQLHSLDQPESFGPWLRTIARRLALREQQRRRKLTGDLPDQAVVPPESPAADLAELNEAMRALPQKQREALALVYFEGYPTDEAARLLGVPAGTLRRRLHDGRLRWRALVEGGRRDTRATGDAGWIALWRSGRIYEAYRTMLTAEPPAEANPKIIAAPEPQQQQWIRTQAARFTQPSPQALDPQHPVGESAAAIRAALAGLRNWPADGDCRHSRAVVHQGPEGRTRSLAELIAASPDPAAFVAEGPGLAFCGVLDLEFAAAELRDVHQLLEELVAAVLTAATPVRLSAYTAEPRYRAALLLLTTPHPGEDPARLAVAGIQRQAPHRAHARLFLEEWATLRAGRAVPRQPVITASSARR